MKRERTAEMKNLLMSINFLKLKLQTQSFISVSLYTRVLSYSQDNSYIFSLSQLT